MIFKNLSFVIGFFSYFPLTRELLDARSAAVASVIIKHYYKLNNAILTYIFLVVFHENNKQITANLSQSANRFLN